MLCHRPGKTSPVLLVLVSLACVLGTLPDIAVAQQETESLREELDQTKAELALANRLIVTLRSEIAMLRSQLREAKDEDTLEPVADLPADPLSCPDSLTRELLRRYERDLGPEADLAQSTPQAYAQHAKDWCDRMLTRWLPGGSGLSRFRILRRTRRLAHGPPSCWCLMKSRSCQWAAHMRSRCRVDMHACLVPIQRRSSGTWG